MTVNRAFILHHFTENIKSYQQYARNIAGIDDADDLFQECAVMLCEYSEERLVSYWNPSQGLKPVFIRMLMLQYRSKTSKFHKEYRKQEQFIQKNGAAIVYNGHQLEQEPDVNPEAILQLRGKVHALRGLMFKNELEEMVFDTYVATGSLRKCLAAIPEKDAHLFSLGKVREIISMYRDTIKKHYSEVN